jgi:hypothetical protein
MERPIGKAGSYTRPNKCKDKDTKPTATAAKPTMAAKPSSAEQAVLAEGPPEVHEEACEGTPRQLSFFPKWRGPEPASSSSDGRLDDEVIPSLEPLEALQDAGIPILFVDGTGIPQCTFPVLVEVLGEQTAYGLTKSLLEVGRGERLDPTYAEAMATL